MKGEHMKKVLSFILGASLLLTACGGEIQESSAGGEEPSTVQTTNEIEKSSKAEKTGFWEPAAAKQPPDQNVLEFTNGLQVIFPQEWAGNIAWETELWQNSDENGGDGGTLLVCEKRNAEAGVGGILFYLDFINRKTASSSPYYLFGEQMEKVLGTYRQEGDEYALIFRLPREMNYVEGNEEMKKAYEDIFASVGDVQIITEHMDGFTECGAEDLDWIEYD